MTWVVHAVLYFIPSTGHALRPLDIIAMKKLGDCANLIPVLAQSDGLTLDERLAFKKRIKQEMVFHGITTFPSLKEEATLPAEERALNDSIRVKIHVL